MDGRSFNVKGVAACVSIGVAVLVLACGRADAHGACGEPPSAPPAAAPAATASEIASAEELLTRLENADKGLSSMQAAIVMHRTFVLEGDEQTRWGMLYFRQLAAEGADAKKQFAVRFDQRRVGQRVEAKEQRFIFDGEWLAEINPDEKRFSKRQLVAPGERFDPLRVGEGPLPVPIGQKKADILARFKAELVADVEGISDGDNPKQGEQWRKFVGGSYQLRLTPLHDDENEDFTEIRLWYKPAQKQEGIEDGRLLPRMARTINHAGDVSTVQLVDVHLNGTIGDEFFSTVSPAERGERGWDINVIPFRKPAPPAAPPAEPPAEQEAPGAEAGTPAADAPK